MSADLIIGTVFGGLGGLLVVIAVLIFIRTLIFINKAREVKGTITRMIYKRSSKGGGGYSPVYQFRTLEGQTIEVSDNLSTNPPMFKEGQVIDVLYDPENPQKARIKKWLSLYFLPMLLGLMGIIFGGVGVISLVAKVISVLRH